MKGQLSGKERSILGVILLLIMILVGMDLVTDSRGGVEWPHLLVELGGAAGAALAFLFLFFDSMRTKHKLVSARGTIAQKEQEVERWRQESKKYVDGLSAAIDTQFNRWSLTHSEKEVALMLLKGLSLKEIADIRETTEKTARSQSVSVYQKAGLAGRSELSAFFLEDLLVPRSVSETSVENLIV